MATRLFYKQVNYLSEYEPLQSGRRVGEWLETIGLSILYRRDHHNYYNAGHSRQDNILTHIKITLHTRAVVRLLYSAIWI